VNPKGPALPFLDFFLSSVFGFCYGKILTFWEREREKRERERESFCKRERDDHTTTMHLNFIHFFLLPLQKKIPRLQLLHTSTHQKQTNSMSAIQFSARAAVAPKISLRKSSKVSVRTGVRAQAVAARKW
jgi:hypothetical protein|tara:strand:- start:953 stop:1342 length:390 start_codon:yes stop_codon:yes gene_type:complete